MMLMRWTTYTWICYFSVQIVRCDIQNISGTSSYHFNMVGCKYIQSTLSHISSQHDTDPHTFQFTGYIGLAATSLWRRNGFTAQNLVVLSYCQNCIILTMTEMVINYIVSGRNCNFHHNLILINVNITGVDVFGKTYRTYCLTDFECRIDIVEQETTWSAAEPFTVGIWHASLYHYCGTTDECLGYLLPCTGIYSAEGRAWHTHWDGGFLLGFHFIITQAYCFIFFEMQEYCFFTTIVGNDRSESGNRRHIVNFAYIFWTWWHCIFIVSACKDNEQMLKIKK